jgi:hypothetical protein
VAVLEDRGAGVDSVVEPEDPHQAGPPDFVPMTVQLIP